MLARLSAVAKARVLPVRTQFDLKNSNAEGYAVIADRYTRSRDDLPNLPLNLLTKRAGQGFVGRLLGAHDQEVSRSANRIPAPIPGAAKLFLDTHMECDLSTGMR